MAQFVIIVDQAQERENPGSFQTRHLFLSSSILSLPKLNPNNEQGKGNDNGYQQRAAAVSAGIEDQS